MLQSLTNGLGRLFGLLSTSSDDDARGQSSTPREGTRIGLAVAIEAPRPGSHEATIFARRLGPSVAFDYRVQLLSDGSVRFFFLAPPSLQVRKVTPDTDFQPEDRRNQTWVRKSGWTWSPKELVDTINFVHLAIHHGYAIPDQRY